VKELPINEKITAPQVHLIMHDGRSAGVVSIDQARYLASEHGLDLIEINSIPKVPIVKLLDYDKYRYHQEKQSRQTVRRGGDLKEMRLSFRIDNHDMETKAKRAKEFLAQGHLVRAFINLRGRENIFPDKAKETLTRFAEMANAVVDQPLTHVGKRIQVILKVGKSNNQSPINNNQQ